MVPRLMAGFGILTIRAAFSALPQFSTYTEPV